MVSRLRGPFVFLRLFLLECSPSSLHLFYLYFALVSWFWRCKGSERSWWQNTAVLFRLPSSGRLPVFSDTRRKPGIPVPAACSIKSNEEIPCSMVYWSQWRICSMAGIFITKIQLPFLVNFPVSFQSNIWWFRGFALTCPPMPHWLHQCRKHRFVRLWHVCK